jgi:hypothetical protein
MSCGTDSSPCCRDGSDASATGPQPLPDREVLCGMLRARPPRRRRPRDWNEAGTRQRLHEVPLAELNTVAKLDSSRCVIDTVSLRAARGGPDWTDSHR